MTKVQFFEQNLPSCMIKNEFSGTIICFGRRDTVRWYVFKNIIDVTSDSDGGQAAATIERTLADTRHTIGDDDGSKTSAIHECCSTNARHTFGNGDRGKAAATRESTIADARHAVGLSIIYDRRRNCDITCIFIFIILCKQSASRLHN